MQSRPQVVVVGGGISGLATAHDIHRRLGASVQLTVVEAGSQLGGKVATEEFSGHCVDTGPDALLVRVPAMAALLEDLGLSDQIVAPASLGVPISGPAAGCAGSRPAPCSGFPTGCCRC